MAALGIGTGIVVHAALACTVGASVFHSFLGVGLFCAASCWMLYLAWKIWPRGRNAFLAGCGDISPASCIYRDALVTNLMNPKATFFFVALSAPLLEKNHDPSYALFIGFLIVATGTAGWILWALVFRWQPIRSFYGRYAVILYGILSLVLAGFGFSMLYSFGRMAVENFS